jgi:hypothetical protein
MRKPWQFAMLGIPFWLAIIFSEAALGHSAAIPPLSGTVIPEFDDCTQTHCVSQQHATSCVGSDVDVGGAAEECAALALLPSLALVQYWAFAVVFLLSSMNIACHLSPSFHRSWHMELARLHCFKCASSSFPCVMQTTCPVPGRPPAGAQPLRGWCSPWQAPPMASCCPYLLACCLACLLVRAPTSPVTQRRHVCRFHRGSNTVEPVSAGQVYHWLLSATVPLDFDIGNVFWDSAKRYLFTPCCLFYGCGPLIVALWSVQRCSATLFVQQLLLATLLVIPNVATAFVFQSYMISVAATVRRKQNAMKGLAHMLSPVRLCLCCPFRDNHCFVRTV